MDANKYTVAGIGGKIQGFLKTVIQDAGFHLTFSVTPGAHLHPGFEDPEVVVKFQGSDVELLLANRAEVLLALEHITMEALRIPAEDHSRVSFDANEYRALRIEELRLSAMTAAEKVKKTQTPFHFSPMNSRERRIIHISLRDEKTIRSESTGTGPFRQVVILPLNMPLPEPIKMPRPREDSDRDRGGRGGGRDRDRDRRGGGGRPPRRHS